MAQILPEEISQPAEGTPKGNTHPTKAHNSAAQNVNPSPEAIQNLREMLAKTILFSPTSLPHGIQPGSAEAIKYCMPSYTKAVVEYKRLMDLKCQALNFQNQGFGRVPQKLLVQLEKAVADHQGETHLMLEELLLNIRQDIAARKEEYKKRKEA